MIQVGTLKLIKLHVGRIPAFFSLVRLCTVIKHDESNSTQNNERV